MVAESDDDFSIEPEGERLLCGTAERIVNGVAPAYCLELDGSSAPVLWGDISDGLRKRPEVAGEILRSVLAFAVRIVRGRPQDFRSMLDGMLVMAVSVGDAHHNVAELTWLLSGGSGARTLLHDHNGGIADVQLRAMVCDA